MSLFEVTVVGFRLNARERPDVALARVLGLSPDDARSLVKRFPVVVRAGLSADEAQALAAVLKDAGAHARVLAREEARAPVVAPSHAAGPVLASQPARATVLEAHWAAPSAPPLAPDPLTASLPLPAPPRPADALLELELAFDPRRGPVENDTRLGAPGAGDGRLARTTRFGESLELPWVQPLKKPRA